MADVVADRPRRGLGGHLVPGKGNSLHVSRYRPCGRFARGASGAGSLISSQPSSGFQRTASANRFFKS